MKALTSQIFALPAIPLLFLTPESLYFLLSSFNIALLCKSSIFIPMPLSSLSVFTFPLLITTASSSFPILIAITMYFTFFLSLLYLFLHPPLSLPFPILFPSFPFPFPPSFSFYLLSFSFSCLSTFPSVSHFPLNSLRNGSFSLLPLPPPSLLFPCLLYRSLYLPDRASS